MLDCNMFGHMLTTGLGSGCVGGLLGGYTAWTMSPESAILKLIKGQAEIEEKFEEMKMTEDLLNGTEQIEITTLRDRVLNDNAHCYHPIVNAFDSWRELNQKLMVMESQSRIITSKHRRLLPLVPERFATPFDAQFLPEIREARDRLRVAMMEIKSDPNWESELKSYNREKTRVAAEETAANSRQTLEEAKEARKNASLAAAIAAANLVKK